MCKINYAKGDANPVESVKFFKIDKRQSGKEKHQRRSRRICTGEPITLIHGDVYQERLVRVFVKDRSKLDLTVAALKAWENTHQDLKGGIQWHRSASQKGGSSSVDDDDDDDEKNQVMLPPTPRGSRMVSNIVSPVRPRRVSRTAEAEFTPKLAKRQRIFPPAT
eukprot:jgi/Bigna1/54941/estExt_Genewise1Plus.C_460055